MSNPIYDDLEDKWSDEYYHRAICDQYWTVTHTATGQEWLEDDEGNEVFPEPPTQTDLNEGVDLSAYIVPNEVKVGDTVTPVKLGEPQFSEGGLIPNLSTGVRVDLSEGYCPVAVVPKREAFEELQELYKVEIIRHEPLPAKRKFKLFGRNQGTDGTL